MAQISWELRGGRPIVGVEFMGSSGDSMPRVLLADTGAGTIYSGFDVVLAESDCRELGGFPARTALLGGAFRGEFPIHLMAVRYAPPWTSKGGE